MTSAPSEARVKGKYIGNHKLQGCKVGSDRFAGKMKTEILPCLQRLELKNSYFLLFLIQYCICLYLTNYLLTILHIHRINTSIVESLNTPPKILGKFGHLIGGSPLRGLKVF